MPFQKGHKINFGRKFTEKTKEKISKANKGRKLSIETRQKISKIIKKLRIKPPVTKYWLGKQRPPETKRKISKKLKGKIISQEVKDKISITMKKKGIQPINKRKDWKGNPPNWKGGITPENIKIRTGIETRLWRESVFARDNWTCQKCKMKLGGKLNSHHIQNFSQYPELRFAIDNGITFCRDCHEKFHKKYGYKNGDQEQIKEFIIKLYEKSVG